MHAHAPHRIVRIALALAFALAAFTPLALAQSSDGDGAFGVTPTNITFDGVIREETVERSFTIQNARSEASRVELTGEGPLAAWLEFPASPFVIPARTNEVITVTLRVPADAANGAYDGRVVVTFMPDATRKEGVSQVDVQYAIPVKFSATVGGDQVLRVEAGGLFVPDVEAGGSVPVSFIVKNTGNVRAAPAFSVRIMTPTGTAVHAEDVAIEPIRAGAEENATVRLTPDLPPGQYRLTAAVMLDGRTIIEESTLFDVLVEGALSRSGEMGAITTADVVTRQPYHRLPAGQDFLVLVPFTNTGDVDLEATFEGYIARDGQVVRTLAPDPLRVAPSETVTFRVLVTDVDKPGSYHVTGLVRYEGKVTEENVAVLTLEPSGGGNRIPGPGPAPVLLVLGAVGVVAAAWAGPRRRT